MAPELDFYFVRPTQEELLLENGLKASLSENKKAYLGYISIGETKIHGYFVPNREKLGFGTFYMPTEVNANTYSGIILSSTEITKMIINNKPLHHQILETLNKKYGEPIGEFLFIGYSGNSYEKGIKITRVQSNENEPGLVGVKYLNKERLTEGFLLDLQKQTEIKITFSPH